MGKIAVYLPKEGADSYLIPVTYPDYCIKAFYLTCQSVEQLEKSKLIISEGNTTTLALGMWFISIEAFINAALRIACRIRKEDFSYRRNAGCDDCSRGISCIQALLSRP